MDYTSDSDLSEDTRDLVEQGLSSVKGKRIVFASQFDNVREHLPAHNMDMSSVRHPLNREVSIGHTSTHGLARMNREIINGQNHNIGTAEVGLEVVVEPKGATKKTLRRSGARELSSEEMQTAYEELEREMNELQNSIGRKTNPSDAEVLDAWKECVETSRAEAYSDLETRAAKLAESAGRV